MKYSFTKDQQEFLMVFAKSKDRWWDENQLRSLARKFRKKYGLHLQKKEARNFLVSVSGR